MRPLERGFDVGGFEFERCPALFVDGETYAAVEYHRETWESVPKPERLNLPAGLVEAMRYLDEEAGDVH